MGTRPSKNDDVDKPRSSEGSASLFFRTLMDQVSISLDQLEAELHTKGEPPTGETKAARGR